MRRLLRVLMLAVSLFAVGSAQGKTPYMPAEELKAEAERGFGEILDLWRDGKFDALYERTLTGGKQTREGLGARLSAAPFRPACCWEKLQELKVSVKNDDTAVIRAKVGLEGSGGTEFRTRSFKLVKEDGVWRISQADILSLSGTAKKKGQTKKKKAYP